MACPICFNNFPLHSAKLCKHSACLPCLKHWYEACEGTGQAAPTCPTCRIPVDQEETRLVLGRQFDTAGRQKDAPGEEAVDELTQQWLSENGAKACRLCGAWLVKDGGCDLMRCRCGYRFCWNCETPVAECDCRLQRLHRNAYHATCVCQRERQQYHRQQLERQQYHRQQLERQHYLRRRQTFRHLGDLNCDDPMLLYDYMLPQPSSPVTDMTPVGLENSDSVPAAGESMTAMGFGSNNNTTGKPMDRAAIEREMKKKKERFLVFTRVLLKYLEQKDPPLHQKVKGIIKDCADRNKRKERGYESVTASMQARLKEVVNESYWKRAEAYLDHFLKNKKSDDSSSSAAKASSSQSSSGVTTDLARLKAERDMLHSNEFVKRASSAIINAQYQNVFSSRDWMPLDAATEIDNDMSTQVSMWSKTWYEVGYDNAMSSTEARSTMPSLIPSAARFISTTTDPEIPPLASAHPLAPAEVATTLADLLDVPHLKKTPPQPITTSQHKNKRKRKIPEPEHK